MIPKLHFQFHLVDDMLQDGLNPKYYQGYADEDYMRFVIRIAWGAAPGSLELTTLDRWLLQQRDTWEQLAASAE